MPLAESLIDKTSAGSLDTRKIIKERNWLKANRGEANEYRRIK